MTWTHRGRNIATAIVGAVLAMAGAVTGPVPAPATAAAPAVTGTETPLGVQMPGVAGSVRSEQSAQGVLPDGRYLAYFASSGGAGTRARFFAMDLTGALAAQVDVPLGTDIRTLTYSTASKSVWFAANGASVSYLYEWDGTTLHQRATLTGHEVMRLGAGSDGSIYIGTFAPSNGRLFQWSGGRLQDHGQPFPGESYVRSLVVDGSSVWLSNYKDSAARLVRFTRSSGALASITTPSTFATEWSALDMSRAGSYLFLRTVNSNRLFAYDVSTGKFASFNDQIGRVHPNPEVAKVVPYIPDISPYGISPLLEGRYIYFQRARAGLMRVDLADGLKTIRVDRYNVVDNRASWTGASVFGPVSYAWLPDVGGRSGHSLVTTTIESKVYINTPGQSGPVVHELPAEDSPSNIITLGSDSSGRIYSGGFDLPSGIGLHDSATGRSSLLQGPQIEGFGRFGGSMVMGGYTGVATASAPLYTYSGSGQPALRININNGQERPVAIQQVGSKVAVGTVPIKGQLGGALSIWDPATNALTVKRNLIPDQSVISLATHNGLVVGGSSNVGGTGSTPKPLDGKLFTYDPATGALKILTPPRFLSATYSFVAAITPDPSVPGRFWAISTGHLIQFEVAADGTLRLTKELATLPNTSSPTGKGLDIEFVGDTLFATVDGGVSAFDTTTGERTVIAGATSDGPVVGLTKDAGQRLYFARGAELFRYTVTGGVGFWDVGTSHPFRSDITWLVDAGVTTGYADGAFRPTAAVSRQAMAAFLHRYAGEPAVDLPTVSPFADVPASHPFYEPIMWLVSTGVTTGYADDTFRPTAAVSRQAMAAFLHRFANAPSGGTVDAGFRDVGVDHPFAQEIAWLVGTGVTTGYSDDTFRPAAPVSRQAMAAFLHRFSAAQPPS